MRLLLDTHILLSVLVDDKALKPSTRRLITAAGQVFVSAASNWEVAIKARLGKLT